MENSDKVLGKLIVVYGPETEDKALQVKILHERLVESNFKVARYFFPEVAGNHTENAINNIIKEHCEYVHIKLLPENDFVITNGYIGNFVVEMLKKGESESEIEIKYQKLMNIFSGDTISFFIDFSHNHRQNSNPKNSFWFFERSSDICGWNYIDGEDIQKEDIIKEIFNILLPVLHDMN